MPEPKVGRWGPRMVEATFQFKIQFNADAYGGVDPGTTAREACYALLRDGDRWDWETVTQHTDRLVFMDAHYEGDEQNEDAREALLRFLPEPIAPVVSRRRKQ